MRPKEHSNEIFSGDTDFGNDSDVLAVGQRVNAINEKLAVLRFQLDANAR